MKTNDLHKTNHTMSNTEIRARIALFALKSTADKKECKWEDDIISYLCINHQINPAITNLLFPKQKYDLIIYIFKILNTITVRKFRILQASQIFQNYGITDKISTYLKLHIHQLALQHYSPNNPCQLTHYITQKCNIKLLFKIAWNTANSAWYTIGDQSLDHNYYTKRMILTQIYSKILKYTANDQSHNYSTSIALVDQEIQKHLTKIKKSKTLYKKITNLFQKSLSSQQ